MIERAGVCVCGVPVAKHYEARGPRMSCDEALRRYGPVIAPQLPELLIPGEAVLSRESVNAIVRAVRSQNFAERFALTKLRLVHPKVNS